MHHSLVRLIKWFCRRLTFNELASAVVIFHEILSSARSDIPLKPDEKPPHYRQFRVDQIPPLPADEKPSAVYKTVFPLPADEKPSYKLQWKLLKQAKESLSEKPINPVRHRNGRKPPTGCKCSHCEAPAKYLYLNNGTLQSQVKCKICGKTSPSYSTKRKRRTKYLCPHCSKALSKWKQSKQSTIYKCFSYTCPHYQYREYHISPDDLITQRPVPDRKANLRNIHNNYHTLGLVLTFAINLGLSSRVTRDALKGIFDICISHQTVVNYINLAAQYLSPYIDDHCPVPLGTSAADETYIIVDNKWTYTWFIIDSKTRAICGYNLSENRGMQPALALLYDTFGKPSNTIKHPDLVTDGNPSYDAAVMAYNDLININDRRLIKRTVIGLENLDDQSKEYRSFKQIVERLNRTYKYHTRPRAGFKTFDGAVALTTLFVAFYNFMRPHSYLKNATPVSLNALKKHSLMPDKWVALIEQVAA